MTSTPLRNLSHLAFIQAVIGLIGALGIGYQWGFHPSASFMAGVALMLGNMIGIGWAWWRVITQKTIAWTVLIIVIKYAVLLSSIYYLGREPWFDVALAGLGITSFLVAVLIWAVTSKEKES